MRQGEGRQRAEGKGSGSGSGSVGFCLAYLAYQPLLGDALRIVETE